MTTSEDHPPHGDVPPPPLGEQTYPAGYAGGHGPSGTRGLARNTAIFSIATGLSRIAGLVREVVAARYFGTSGPASAFTLAFQIPNLLRGLVADAALSAAFVPVFTEMLEENRRQDAAKLASTLLLVIVAGLGAIMAIFILGAGVVMPAFAGHEFSSELVDLTVGLSRVLSPIVVLLGVNGLVVGILNAYGHFSIPAIAPLVWNVVIIGALVFMRGLFDGPDQLYAYALGVLAGTVVQLAMALWALRRIDFRFERALDLRDPRLKQVFALMLPVTIGLGAINFNLVINSGLGTLVSDEAPRAIDAAFRIYMLPQGIFSVALATVLFPTLSRYAARHDLEGLRGVMSVGVRQIFLFLIPAAAATMVLAEPITRLVFERGTFDAHSTAQVSRALFWFSFSLPFAGVNLLLTRTFFSLQRPWVPTGLAIGNLAITAAVSLALYKPFGIAGVVIGTAAGSAGMTITQAIYLRRELHGRLEGRRTVLAAAQMTVASAVLAGVSYGIWWLLDDAVGRSLPGQVVSVTTAMSAGALAYAGIVFALRIPEALQIRRFATGWLRRGRAG